MRNALLLADDILRGRGSSYAASGGVETAVPRLRRHLLTLLTLLVTFGVVYGTMMGTFGGLRGDRALQIVYSATKVPLLLIVTFLIALPSFFVLNSLLG